MKFKKYILLLAFLICTFSAFAHPHMFLTSKEEFVFEGNKLAGCWIEWEFDSYFSADIIYSYDFDQDGIYNKEETDAVYNNAFINLKNYYFFTFIRQGKTRTNPEKVENFSVHQKDGLILYRFYIDLSEYEGNELYLAVYDYTFFCDIRYPENPVSFKYDPNLISVNYTIEKNENYPVYYDPLASSSNNTVYYEWEPGLQTYYPKEIHITYK